MVMNKLRMAILSVHSCPMGNLGARDTGGMSVYIRELARALGQQGHYVDVYTRVHDPADPQIVDIARNARLIHLSVGQEEAIPKLALYSYLPEFACNLENFRKSAGLQYDLVFSHYWLSGMVGEYLQQWWHVPHIAMFHTLGAVKNAIGIGEDEPELRMVTERESAGQLPSYYRHHGERKRGTHGALWRFAGKNQRHPLRRESGAISARGQRDGETGAGPC